MKILFSHLKKIQKEKKEENEFDNLVYEKQQNDTAINHTNNYLNSNYTSYSYTSIHPPPAPPPLPPFKSDIETIVASVMSSSSLASSNLPILYKQNNNMNSNEKVNENMISMKNFFVPKQVTLSWTSLTIKARSKSYLDLPMAILRKKLKRKRNEIILNKIHGMVEPGQLLALMGPR